MFVCDPFALRGPELDAVLALMKDQANIEVSPPARHRAAKARAKFLISRVT
jgi:hypothetical protein